MKKTLILLMFSVVVGSSVQAQRVDTGAVYIMDRMVSLIGDLSSCRFQMTTSQDVKSTAYGSITTYTDYDVTMASPDKMHIESQGDKGHRGFWYDGNYLVYYAYDENNYSVIEASGNVVSMIDSMHAKYEFDFPAADFFYPNLVEDILKHFDNIVYLGNSNVNDTKCHHILFSNEHMAVQLWIASNGYTLPKRVHIVYKKRNNRQYEATIHNWELNPLVPETIFEFHPPQGAKEIYILPAE